MKKLFLILHLLIIAVLFISCTSTNSSGDADGLIVGTPTNTSVPSQALSSTLSLEQKEEILTNLYENNEVCQLPCYLGIMPGESSWTDTSSFLDSVGEIKGPGGTDKVPNYGVIFDVDGAIGAISPIIWVKDDLVMAISINSRWVSAEFDYSLSGILSSFGVPEEVWIRPIFDASDHQPFYYLVLMYQSKGINVELAGNIENQNGNLVICPQDIFSRHTYPPRLFLWNPKEQVEFNNFGKELIDSDLGWVIEEYRLIQDVSVDDLTNMRFYEIYSDPNTKHCINVVPVS
jgi:hypothetical protein